MRTRFSRALGGASAVLLALFIAAPALADTLVVSANTVNATGDATVTSGQSGTAFFWLETVDATDPVNGCNATGNEPVVLNVTSSSSSIVLATSTVTVTGCGSTAKRGVGFTTTGTQDGTISATYASGGKRGGTYATSDTMAVDVVPAAPVNTAPTVVVTGVAHGGTYGEGSVPAAGCSVADAQDGASSFAATLGAITGPYAAFGVGQQTASCSYTDAGGLGGTASATFTITDSSAPEIGRTIDPAGPNGSNDWYTSAVSLAWTVLEQESVLTTSGCDAVTVSSDGVHPFTCSADSAGGHAEQSVTIKYDGTAPRASCAPAPVAWSAVDVTVGCTASDVTSGLAAPYASGAFSRTAEQASGVEGQVTVPGVTVRDLAGNGTPLDPFSVNIDKKAPTVGCATPAPTFILGQPNATVTGTAVDGGSDVPSSVATGSADTSTIGSRTTRVSATDNVGNEGSAACGYSVVYAWKGFFQPIDTNAVNKAKAGSTIPVKFSLTGNQGLDILVGGAPAIGTATCSLGVMQDAVEEYATDAVSGLKYDATADQYVYNWKTSTKMVGTCQQLIVKLKDGTTHRATFTFTK